MGLFGDSKRTQTTQTTNYNTSVGLEGEGNLAVVGNGNTLTDNGAITAALAFAETQGELMRDAVAETLGVASGALESGVAYGRNAFAFADNALTEYRGITRDGLQYAADIFGEARESIDQATAASQSTIGQTVAALNGIVTEARQSESGKLIELAGYALAAIAAIAILPGLLKGARNG